jgi:hypothetical protein
LLAPDEGVQKSACLGIGLALTSLPWLRLAAVLSSSVRGRGAAVTLPTLSCIGSLPADASPRGATPVAIAYATLD